MCKPRLYQDFGNKNPLKKADLSTTAIFGPEYFFLKIDWGGA